MQALASQRRRRSTNTVAARGINAASMLAVEVALQCWSIIMMIR